MMQTTLKAIRKHGPCEHGWVKLLSSLGKTKADDAPLSLLEILKSNGLDDALWCLRAVDGHDEEIRLYAVWCARQVQHLMTDPRSLAALDVAEAFANGKATKEELDAARAAARAASRAAWSAARDAARDAAGSAADAAWDAAWDASRAAWAAARDAAGDAAWAAADAAWDAAWDAVDAAWAAARDAAGDAAWAAADAAWDAARDAAGDAAWAAADAARAAADAAWAAWSAARAAARATQEKELIRICKLSEKEISHV